MKLEQITCGTALQIVPIKDLEIHRNCLVLDALLKHVTKIGFSHLTWEGIRALYFVILFHIDSCDFGVLFGGDKKGKVTKS